MTNSDKTIRQVFKAVENPFFIGCTIKQFIPEEQIYVSPEEPKVFSALLSRDTKMLPGFKTAPTQPIPVSEFIEKIREEHSRS